MFVGFIAVVVILLIIVGLMSTGSLSGSKNSNYIAEAKKVQAMLSNINNEGSFFYSKKNETFSGIDMDYFVDSKFAPNYMVTDNPGMNEDDWDGWPTIDQGEALDANDDGVLDSPYTGAYIKLNGTPGDQMRIIVTPINNGKQAGVFILKKKVNTIPEEYVKILESTLANDPSYIGG